MSAVSKADVALVVLQVLVEKWDATAPGLIPDADVHDPKAKIVQRAFEYADEFLKQMAQL